MHTVRDKANVTIKPVTFQVLRIKTERSDFANQRRLTEERQRRQCEPERNKLCVFCVHMSFGVVMYKKTATHEET